MRSLTTTGVQRFTFGRNWARFSQNLTDDVIREAVDSVNALVGRDFLTECPSALDLGCGSGIFSLALIRLGVSRVIAVDVDPDSVLATTANAERFLTTEQRQRFAVRQGSILDADFIRSLPASDLVYAWGSLHHTGNFTEAFHLAAEKVAPGGMMAAAVYNRCWSAPAWHWVKRRYSQCPGPVQYGLGLMLFTGRAAVRLARGRHPLRERRGMNIYHDAFDWLGGYPYEFASPEEVLALAGRFGLSTEVVHRTSGSGCNEYLFRRLRGSVQAAR